MRFEGIYTPIVTPYNADFSINRDRFADTVEHLISHGVSGIVLAGTTGEYYAQTAEERIGLMAFTMERIKGRVPLIIGTGAMATAESIAYAEEAKKAGADALLIATPPYAYPTEREIALHALAIDRAANLPVMLYNYPGRMSVNMGAETFDRLGRSPNFCAIKESSGDPNQLHMLARDYPHIQLSCGMDDQALEFFAWGARSWVCAPARTLRQKLISRSTRPAPWKAISIRAGASCPPCCPCCACSNRAASSFSASSTASPSEGIEAGPPRRPLQPLNKDEKRELAEVIKTMNVAINAIEKEA